MAVKNITEEIKNIKGFAVWVINRAQDKSIELDREQIIEKAVELHIVGYLTGYCDKCGAIDGE